ncbi:MAG: ATP-dependent sacrificial sulfur transferase LarE [Verrucomicrobiota bacterium]
MESLSDKEKKLQEILMQLEKPLIAYSGGVDSSFLLWSAWQALPNKTLGILADSPSLARSEKEAAQAFAKDHQIPIEIIQTQELKDPDYAANPLNRCYFCKHELFNRMQQFALDKGYSKICYGENLDDLAQERPGNLAAKKFQILAPLRQAGLKKQDIRALARKASLTVSNKVASPCLSSRIVYGIRVTPERLQQVEAAEDILRREGFRILRVRHQGHAALLQVSPQETAKLLRPSLQKKLTPMLQEIGFREIHFDPEGYRGASLESIPETENLKL